jgi:asparagine synthase (glutamine-hydrolysing)
MCGICGYTGEQNPALIRKMMDRMIHRGPDDSGYFTNKDICLGMVRLSIIDLHRGHQPISNEDGTIWVVFNGEVYNYIELRQSLEAAGHKFETSSDTETIVHGFEEYGLALPHQLNGMFAIAIWDARSQSLILIRDRFGVKPLFYTYKSNVLVFGSEIKTLLCHPLVSRDIDFEALSHYFSLRNVPAPFSIYKDIRALPPGHMLICTNKGKGTSKWYELPMASEFDEKGEDILVQQIDDILHDSVRLRLRSDVKFGAYLSGGIDSSTIVGIMSEYSAQPVETFSLAFADTPAHKRDAYYARIIAEKYGTKHHEYVMHWSELQKELETIICHLDQPFAGVIASYWLSRFMKRYVTVALSGDGADDLFGSYGHHRLVWPIAAVKKSIDQGTPLDAVDFGYFRDRTDFVIKLARYQPWEWRLAYAAFMEDEKEDLFSEKGREAFASYSTSSFLQNIYEACNPEADELNHMLYLDINTLLHNEILYFNDMLSMANSMEVRTPFLDYRIVELACSIPGSLKIKNQELKYILRRVAARYVPEDILERPKEGFVLPKNTWLREGMAVTLRGVLSKERLGIHSYFNQGYIDSLMAKFINGDDTLTFKIWTLMVFQIWYENYLGA